MPLKHAGGGFEYSALVDDRVQATIARMHERLSRPLTMPEMAAAVGLSVSQLTRLFQHDTGMTPGQFLHRLRMSTARRLIEHTSLPVVEIMAQVGISNRSHFARHFRHAHGLSPRALRKQLRRHPSAVVV